MAKYKPFKNPESEIISRPSLMSYFTFKAHSLHIEEHSDDTYIIAKIRKEETQEEILPEGLLYEVIDLVDEPKLNTFFEIQKKEDCIKFIDTQKLLTFINKHGIPKFDEYGEKKILRKYGYLVSNPFPGDYSSVPDEGIIEYKISSSSIAVDILLIYSFYTYMKEYTLLAIDSFQKTNFKNDPEEERMHAANFVVSYFKLVGFYIEKSLVPKPHIKSKRKIFKSLIPDEEELICLIRKKYLLENITAIREKIITSYDAMEYVRLNGWWFIDMEISKIHLQIDGGELCTHLTATNYLSFCYYQCSLIIAHASKINTGASINSKIKKCTNPLCESIFIAHHGSQKYCPLCNSKTVFSQSEDAKRKRRDRINNQKMSSLPESGI